MSNIDLKNMNSKSEMVKRVAKSRGYSFVSSGVRWLWDISFDYKTFFELQKMNTQAQSAKDLIKKMIGRGGIMFIKDGMIYEDNERAMRVKKLFMDAHTWSWTVFKDKYYTNYFCSGMVFGYFATMGDGSKRIQILDSRNIEQKFDSLGNIKEFKYDGSVLNLWDIVGQIIKYDPDKPWYWMSIYQTVVFDALSDRESAKRNYMFFRNGAIPNIILTMDDDLENEDEINSAIDQFEQKYKGTDNSHWILALWGVKEVRTLDVSNRDLELLDLRKFNVKVFGMLFGFDPRFLAFRDGENWSHSEYTQMAIQSDKTMQSYADVLEEFMLKAIHSLYPTSFPYDEVYLVNDTFLDEETKIKIYKEEIQNAISTPAEVIKKLGKKTNDLDENMHKYYMNIQYNTVGGLINESESRTKANIAKAENK